MRTTLVLQDDLVEKAKIRAAQLGTTLSKVVNDALRQSLEDRDLVLRENRPTYRVLGYGGEGNPPAKALTPEEIHELSTEGEMDGFT